jgi:hypothetical protein
MRHRLPWIVAVPVMAAGSLAAHSFTAALTGTRAETGHETAERASNGTSGHLTLLIGFLSALVLVVLARRLLSRQRRSPSAVTFALLPPLSFAVAEIAERLLHAESFPFQPALEPRFLIGLALQAPFGVLAYLLARLLTRVIEHVARALRARPLSRTRRQPVRWRAPAGADVPRIPTLALGYPQRGPPLGI